MAKLDKVFKAAVDMNASDIHVVPDEPFIIRHLGRLRKLKNTPLTLNQCRELIFEILTESQREILEQSLQLDFGYELSGVGRFRGSAMQHQEA